MPRPRRKIALLLLGVFLAGLSFLLYIDHALTAPRPAVIGPPPPDFHAESVELRARRVEMGQRSLAPASFRALLRIYQGSSTEMRR